jgi:hypothetical protein
VPAVKNFLQRLSKHHLAGARKLAALARNALRKRAMRQQDIGSWRFDNISILGNWTTTLQLPGLPAGSYEITLAHRDYSLFCNRKQAHLEFENCQFQTGKLKKQKKSFDYFGLGSIRGSSIFQSVRFTLPEDSSPTMLRLVNKSRRKLVIDRITLAAPAAEPKVPSQLERTEHLHLVISKINESGKDVIVFCPDVNLNSIDGSSVWAASLCSLLPRTHHLIVLSKHDLVSDVFLANTGLKKLSVLSPKDFTRVTAFTTKDLVSALLLLDDSLLRLRWVILRGLQLNYAAALQRRLSQRICAYITDFYALKDGSPVSEEALTKTRLVLSTCYVAFSQTPQLASKLQNISGGIHGRLHELPPAIPSWLVGADQPNRPQRPSLRIGYAGKVTADWGVSELLDLTHELRKRGHDVRLRIIAGRRSGLGSANIELQRNISSLSELGIVELHSDVPRRRAAALLAECDAAWCWRPPHIEDNALEVSCKLLEAVALGIPAFCSPSHVNVWALDAEYPYFLERPTPEAFERLLLTLHVGSARAAHYRNQIIDRFGEATIAKTLSVLFSDSASKLEPHHRTLFAGNDFKFVDAFIGYCKLKGHSVAVDRWKWGEPEDLPRSEQQIRQANTIFCEWGLANAAWFSRNVRPEQRLLVRIHAQEIRAPASKHARQIKPQNVTKFVFVSEEIRQTALSMYAWPEHKTTLIPNFVLTNEFSLCIRPPLSTKRRVVLGLAGIIPQTKRFDRAVDLLQMALAKGLSVALHIAGPRPESYEYMYAPHRRHELIYYNDLYQRIVSSPDLKAAIYFDGWQQDMKTWYSHVDVILSPSTSESFHYALADGIATGCLPIIWERPGAAELYDSSMVAANTTEALHLLQKYANLSEDDQLNTISTNRGLIQSRYSYQHIFPRLEEMLTPIQATTPEHLLA